ETRHATGHFMTAVAELASPYQVYQLQPAVLAYYGLCLITIVSLFLNRKHLRLSAFLVIAAFFVMAQDTIRNTSYFVFLAAPFAAQNLMAWKNRRQHVHSLGVERLWLATGAVTFVFLIWSIATDRYYLATQQPTTRFGWHQSPYAHVEKALTFA